MEKALVSRTRLRPFARLKKNPLINLLYNERLRRILNMINLRENEKSIILDLGCGKGHFSRVLSLRSITIGLDISKRAVAKAQVQGRVNRLHFIVADISSLPFRSHSIGVVACVSVLEHIQDLNCVLRQIKDVLKRDGLLVVGYPIETELFKHIWRLVSPRNFKLIDQTNARAHTFWVHPYTHKQECYWESPFTHKQDYRAIRDVLRKYFRILEREKLPFDGLSDLLSYYECVKCTPA